MPKRIFCEKCMRMVLASPNIFPIEKSTHWRSTCGCKIKKTQLKEIEIKTRTRYYTEKHGYLFNHNKQVKSKWSFKDTK